MKKNYANKIDHFSQEVDSLSANRLTIDPSFAAKLKKKFLSFRDKLQRDIFSCLASLHDVSVQERVIQIQKNKMQLDSLLNNFGRQSTLADFYRKFNEMPYPTIRTMMYDAFKDLKLQYHKGEHPDKAQDIEQFINYMEKEILANSTLKL